MDNFYIYRHIRLDTNTPFYVGKGCKKRAYTKHKRNYYWNNIVNKYGYKVEIIIKNLSERSAFEKEKKIIKTYKELGYCEANLCDGGEGSSGYIWSLNQKNSFSKIKKNGYIENPQYRYKIRQGKLNSIKNDPSQVTRQRESLINYYKDENNRHKNSISRGGKKFEAIDKKSGISVWSGYSQKLCAEELQLQQPNINKCLKKQRKTHQGYIFKYKD